MSSTSAVPANPEVGLSVATGDILTNYHDVGPRTPSEAKPLLLLHGSGPGVSAFANWRLVFGAFSATRRVLAPDLAGFGFSAVPEGIEYTRQRWLNQIVSFLDALGVDQVDLVGNSFGGSMALALAVAHPERVGSMVLMGSVGVPFEITQGLDDVWGYEPSLESMARLMRETFAYNASFVTDDLVRMRYEASIRPGAQEQFSSMFPAPRQRWVDAMSFSESDVRALRTRTLMVHGRDDKVIPLNTSLTLNQWIADSQVHIFGRCGHWTQIEHTDAFTAVVLTFLDAQR